MKKRPSNKLLLAMRSEGYSFERMAMLCDTSRYTIVQWYDEAEIEEMKSIK